MNTPSPDTNTPWQRQGQFLQLHSPWMTLVGEYWRDAQGQQLEYWRVEKADSVIVLPVQQDSQGQRYLLLPPASFRPGVGQLTLDFPGGRCLEDQTPEEAALAILQRELTISKHAIVQLVALNPNGWAINSSFSNQRLYGFVANLEGEGAEQLGLRAAAYPVTSEGLRQLLSQLTCLQCRAVLLEWYVSPEFGLLQNKELL